MSETLEQRVVRVTSDVFGFPLEKLSLETTYQDVPNWDSLNLLNLLMAIEAEFDISVAPEEAAEFVSVERVLKLVRAKLGN